MLQLWVESYPMNNTSTTRKLTADEVEHILDFIQPQRGIPHDTAMSIVNMTKKRFVEQLEKIVLYPELIPELKKDIKENYFTSQIQPGESVGIICAQSIGQKQTQATLNTFHKAGQSEKTMTAGVPRFQELINASKKPHIVNHKIYLKDGNSNVKEIRETVGHTIAGFTLGDLSEKITVEMNKEDEKWYDAHKLIFGDSFSEHEHCITFKLNMKKLYEYKLTMKDIADFIHSEYCDLHCVFSPPMYSQLDVFVDVTTITLPEDRLHFIDHENAHMIYLEEVVQHTLERKYVCGIPSITEVFFVKEKGENGEWIVETNGFNSRNISKQFSSYKQLLAHPNVDYTKTISNNVWDIYEVLDIEAARQFLIEEFMGIMEGINVCHAMLLVDRMTHSGTISSISRFTLKKEESGPMGKASFEETMENFLNAAAQGDIESTEGVSASIICGKRANIGTGMVKVVVDMPKLPQSGII